MSCSRRCRPRRWVILPRLCGRPRRRACEQRTHRLDRRATFSADHALGALGGCGRGGGIDNTGQIGRIVTTSVFANTAEGGLGAHAVQGSSLGGGIANLGSISEIAASSFVGNDCPENGFISYSAGGGSTTLRMMLHRTMAFDSSTRCSLATSRLTAPTASRRRTSSPSASTWRRRLMSPASSGAPATLSAKTHSCLRRPTTAAPCRCRAAGALRPSPFQRPARRPMPGAVPKPGRRSTAAALSGPSTSPACRCCRWRRLRHRRLRARRGARVGAPRARYRGVCRSGRQRTGHRQPDLHRRAGDLGTQTANVVVVTPTLPLPAGVALDSVTASTGSWDGSSWAIPTCRAAARRR